jgi:hypothetical protein
MLEALTPFQIFAFGSMATFSTLSLARVASALDSMVMLRRMQAGANRLQSALSIKDETRRGAAVNQVLQRITRKDTAQGRLFTAFRGSREYWDAAKERFQSDLDLLVTPHLHNLSRPARMAGPLGLGFTVLALTVSLLAMDPSGSGAGANLLKALPVSLITTAVACFNVVMLTWTQSSLNKLAWRVAGSIPASFDACAAAYFPEEKK